MFLATRNSSPGARVLLTQTAEYALRAALWLAEHPERAPASVAEMAKTLRIPQNYLSKTLHQLARTGVVHSTRGKRGGFRLDRDPALIPLYDIVAPFERFAERGRCILGRPVCSDQTACAAHERWKHVSETAAAFFRETSLADLRQGSGRPSRAAAR